MHHATAFVDHEHRLRHYTDPPGLRAVQWLNGTATAYVSIPGYVPESAEGPNYGDLATMRAVKWSNGRAVAWKPAKHLTVWDRLNGDSDV